jgi:hypothetical protein
MNHIFTAHIAICTLIAIWSCWLGIDILRRSY